MRTLSTEYEVRGPWSLATSRRFWEGFAPAALAAQASDALSTVFRVEADWSWASAEVTQRDSSAVVQVRGEGDLEAAAAQVTRFLSLDVDAEGWPEVGKRDAVIADAQRELPGLRPCGFHSPYEAAAWAVLSQRIRIVQAARLRAGIIEDYGDEGAFPSPERLRRADLDLPGRKNEFLRAVADAAIEGRLDTATLRSVDPQEAEQRVQQIKGIGPFAAELVVLRGANVPDAVPANESRLHAEIAERYGDDAVLDEVSLAWRPFRTWACVLLRAMREYRTHEIG
ncbi:DNA-3-methyladenine glycosylase [Allobranchiibius sp. GilTou73]|uniref:DNA-3-methyladenine glycosylase family protein n=1 Tax=Allobranchiibius sp. GilTou73 TaxID=2904523 RepID=UPI001F181459|nr:hypothetical protein [Allobranchiibius sp. GilTou73]UIJ36441.1 hypothetical protein LVQ62_08815 [Allobranchiibius sp. GilTou73]